VLEVESVSVELGGRPVLEGVDLIVEPGEIVGLIGPNGAGKTTLLRAVLGLVPVQAGAVRLEPGASVGYVPQRHDFAWDFPISVERAVMSGRVRRVGWLRRPGRADWHAVEQALEQVALTHLRRRPIGELSGGQRQRTLVARALAVEPRLLLLDEPLSGVDVPTQEVLGELFRGFREDGGALLMTTHDLPAAAETCTRLCLLNRTLIADAPPDELRDPAPWLRAFGMAWTS
jgi:manganese/iron transport system ATP-binding protein